MNLGQKSRHQSRLGFSAGLLGLAALFTLASAPQTQAKARPHHQHQDAFNEKDIWIGTKAGLMVTSYSSVRNSNQSLQEVPAKAGYFGGLAFQLVYDFPRIEADFFGVARGGLYNGSWVYSAAIPVLLKFPIEFEQGSDLVLGIGAQNDFLIGGMQNLRATLAGPLVSVGATVDLYPVTLEFEGRYLYGIRNLSRDVHGGRPQDIQLLFGVFWHL